MTLVSNMAVKKIAILRTKFQLVFTDTNIDSSTSVVMFLHVFSPYKNVINYSPSSLKTSEVAAGKIQKMSLMQTDSFVNL